MSFTGWFLSHATSAGYALGGLRIALFSDVHANLAALRAVLDELDRRRVDAIYALGDLVGRGPEPEAVARLIRRRGIKSLRGNWDEWVAGGEGWDQRPKRKALVEATQKLMKHRSRARLIDWPERRRLVFGGVTLLLAHGSPRDPVELLTPEVSDQTLKAAIAGADADIVALGHSHRPFIRRIEGTLLINTGTVGYAFDGDPRASFALIELLPPDPPEVEIVRVPYPLERNLQAMRRRVKARIVPAEIELRYRRALLGEGDEPREPLRARDSGADALVKILAKPIREVYQAPASDKLARESERIRRRRAAGRRLKEAFALARPMLPSGALDQPLWNLDQLQHTLGQRRAPDALLAELEAAAGSADPALVSGIREALERRRARSGKRVATLYARERLVDEGLLALGLAMLPKKEGATVMEAAGMLLARRARAVAARMPSIEDPADAQGHHRLRLALRRLRYAAKLLDPLLPELALGRSAKIAGTIDDALGGLNDLTLLIELIDSRRGRRIVRPHDPGSLLADLRAKRSARHRAAWELARLHGPALQEALLLGPPSHHESH